MAKKLPATGLIGAPPHYYGEGPRDYGVEFLVSTSPDAWQMLRDETSWSGWVWRWTKQQAEDEAAKRTAETGAAHRVFSHTGVTKK